MRYILTLLFFCLVSIAHAQFTAPLPPTIEVTADSLSEQVYYLDSVKAEKLANKINAAKARIKACDTFVQKLENRVANLEGSIIRKNGIIDDKDAQIRDLLKTIEGKEQQLENNKPKWYDSNVIYFILGCVLTGSLAIGIGLGTKN